MAPGSTVRFFINESSLNGSSNNESYTDESLTAEPFTGESLTGVSLSVEPFIDESLIAETFASDLFTKEPFSSDCPTSLPFNNSLTAEPFTTALFTNQSLTNNDSFEAEPFANSSFINGSSWQQSESVSIIIGNNLTLTTRLISSFCIAVACASAFNNSLLLWAIPRVDKSALKAKHFIQNLTITNLLLPIILANELLFLITLASLLDEVTNMCIFGMHSLVVVGLFLSQSLCVLSLASDRIYAVVRPLTYNTIGYSKSTLTVILIIPWLVALGICGIFLYVAFSTLPPTSVTGEPIICFLILSASLIAESSHVLDSFLICANISCFFVYMCLFAVFKYQQRTIHNLSMTTVRKTNVLLVRVYFMLNVTTLVLYLPAPIFSVFQTNAIENDRSVNDIILALFSIYLLNTCLDPIILMSRIPSIRQNLPIKFKRVTVKRATSSQRTESVNT